mmetsp:Transcript_11206/g.51972  ORF Transcript_11206/g.51972 Transcript_11206/m.51972 type:complete len:220 (-) Transcript_11206:1782-2441(-)
MIHVQPSLLEILRLDVEELALDELVRLAELGLAVVLGPGWERRRSAVALAHVGVVGDAAGAAVFESFVAIDAHARLDEGQEQDPQDPNNQSADEPVRRLLLLPEPEVVRDHQLRERQHAHAHHNVQRALRLHSHRLSRPSQRNVLIRTVRDAQTAQRDEVGDWKHRAVDDGEGHRLERRRVLLREDELGRLHGQLGHVLGLGVFGHRLPGLSGEIQIRD